MSEYSFYGKLPALAAENLDIVAYELTSVDCSRLPGAKALKFKRTPGIGSSIQVYGYWAGHMQVSCGIIEGTLPGMQFSHSASTEPGFSGTPIMVDGAVAGIHIGTRGVYNVGLQTDFISKFVDIADTLILTEDSADLWKKTNLRLEENDVFLWDSLSGNELEQEKFTVRLRNKTAEYSLQARNNLWKVHTWTAEDEELPALDDKFYQDYIREDFRMSARQAHQVSQKDNTGGLMKIVRKWNKSKPQVPTCGSPAGLKAQRAERKQALWDHLRKSGRTIPHSLIGLGLEDFLQIREDRLDSTLINLAELLGLQTASFKIYWQKHLLNLDYTQKRHLMMTWVGILQSSGFLPSGEKL
jgi:hypothetical protein